MSTIGDIQGDTRSLDYGSYGSQFGTIYGAQGLGFGVICDSNYLQFNQNASNPKP